MRWPPPPLRGPPPPLCGGGISDFAYRFAASEGLNCRPTNILGDGPWRQQSIGIPRRRSFRSGRRPLSAANMLPRPVARPSRIFRPSTARCWPRVASCDKEDVDRAVTAARDAFNKGKWANAAPKQRKRTLQKLAELIVKHADELALLETLDMGKPISFARSVDMNSVAETVRWYAEAIDKIYDEIAPTPKNALA